MPSSDTEQEALSPVQIELVDRVINGVLSRLQTAPRAVYHDRPLKRLKYRVELIVEMDQHGYLNSESLDRIKMMYSSEYAKILERCIERMYPNMVGVKVKVKPKFESSKLLIDA